jgi:hypothetical protein
VIAGLKDDWWGWTIFAYASSGASSLRGTVILCGPLLSVITWFWPKKKTTASSVIAKAWYVFVVRSVGEV